MDVALRIENYLDTKFKPGKEYQDKIRSIIYNINDKVNIQPAFVLLSKQVTPEEFAELDLRTLAHEEIQNERKKAFEDVYLSQRTDLEREQVVQDPSYQGMFRC